MSLPEIKLNEKNIQACFLYNADTGEWTAETITGDFTLDVDNPRIKTQDGSLKMALDLGHSIDGSLQDLVFKIDNQIMAIKPVAQRTDLVHLNLAINECAIVTNDPNFRTIVWVNRDNIGKNFFYKIKSLQSGISNWMFNEVARKLNKLDTAKIESDILNLNIEVMNIDTRVTTTENNINDLDNEVLDINAKLMDNTAEIDILKNNVSTLQTDTQAIADRTLNNENDIEKLQEKTEGIIRDENTDTTIFNDDLKLNKKLEVLGNTSLQNTTVKDLEVNGNIVGVLKDENGYKFIKVKKGTVANSGRFMNMTIEYDGVVAVIKGNYSVASPQTVASLDIFNLSVISPLFITKLKKIFFYNTKRQLEFATGTTINDDTSFDINFRNITAVEQDIKSTTFDFIIEAEINPTDINITWA